MMRHAEHMLKGRARAQLNATIGAILVVAIAAIAHRYFVRPDNVTGEAARLARVVSGHRLTRARLSGPFAYVACVIDSSAERMVTGMICNEARPSTWKTADALRRLGDDMRRRLQSMHTKADTAEQSHASGVWQLVWGNVDDAVADLRKSAQLQPTNSRTLNDLAAGLTAFAERHDDPSALIDAFVAADSAVRLDGASPEARFTLALILEDLYLRVDAISAWNIYLGLDRSTRWANEARDHIAALTRLPNNWKVDRERLVHAAAVGDSDAVRSIVALHPAATRALIQEQLGGWGNAVAAGRDTEAKALLNSVRILVRPLRATTDDPFEADAVAAIDRARGDRLRALAAGYVAMRDGQQLIATRDFPTAAIRFTEAQHLFTRGGSPMSLVAELSAANLRYRQGSAGLRIVQEIRDSANDSYRVLRSSAAKTAGRFYDMEGDYVHVVAAYESAIAEGQTTGDPEIAVRGRSYLAQKLTSLRGREAGWRVLYTALAVSPRFPESLMSLNAAYSSAAISTGSEAPRLALRYLDETIRIARQTRQADVLAVAFTLRARQLAQMRELDAARVAVDSALRAAESVTDRTARATLVADATLAGGLAAVHASPAEAEEALRRVVAQYQADDYGWGLPSAYLYLAQSRIATGLVDGARSAFDSAMAIVERQRESVADYAERTTFLDNARETIDQIVTFRADHGDSVGAFEFFEDTRSRVLLEELTSAAHRVTAVASGSVLGELRRRLPAGTLVVSYAVLPRELLIWTIGRDRFVMRRVPVTSQDLASLVAQLRQSLDAPSTVGEKAAHRLDDLLVAQGGALDPACKIVLIPDRSLHAVPFVALRDEHSGRYLVQDHELSSVPSARLLIDFLSRGKEGAISATTSRMLAVGNPRFDSTAFPLAQLPASEREARDAAAVYRNSLPLTGVQATDVALRDKAPNVDVLHFAGHAIVRTDAPQMSHLVLAPSAGSSGAVFSSDIAKWRLDRIKLVILSACSTSGGSVSATEGTSSLARAFFVAGASRVIASLWAIDDERTADFFVAVHRHLGNGEPPAMALRSVQMEWIANGRPASTWAAFQLFGS
jgi:CHAT domain-containing protein